MDRAAVTTFAWLSIAAALATIALKASAYYITGSVGLLSDALALESIVTWPAARRRKDGILSKTRKEVQGEFFKTRRER
jgi:hypothetical protein